MNPRKIDLQRDGLRRVIANAISAKSQRDPHEYATQRWGAGRPPPMDFVERAGVGGSVAGDASPFASESQAFFEFSERRFRCGIDAAAQGSVSCATCQRVERRGRQLDSRESRQARFAIVTQRHWP